MNNSHKLRKQIYQLLESGSKNSHLGMFVDVFLILLIVINVAAVILETEPYFQSRYVEFFQALEIFSVSVFTIEYGLRLWSCVEAPGLEHQNQAHPRISYVFTPMAIIDFIAIAPFYLAFIFNIDLRFLRVLRLLRIFKLTRYSGAMTTLLKVIHDQISTLAAALFIMIVIMIVAASGIFLVEHDDQPEVFGTIPRSMWWAIVTLTTVGYGDVVPLSFAGKIFATVIMIAGVGLVALPTGILASSFSETVKRNREKLTRQMISALEDGVIDENEQRALDTLSSELGLSPDVLLEIQHSMMENKRHHVNLPKNCPHCGKSIT